MAYASGIFEKNFIENFLLPERFKDIDLLAEPGYKLRMVLNSYRASGTGGYDIYREVPVLQSFSTDIQDVLIESFEQTVPVKVPSPTDFEVIL